MRFELDPGGICVLSDADPGDYFMFGITSENSKMPPPSRVFMAVVDDANLELCWAVCMGCVDGQEKPKEDPTGKLFLFDGLESIIYVKRENDDPIEISRDGIKHGDGP